MYFFRYVIYPQSSLKQIDCFPQFKIPIVFYLINSRRSRHVSLSSRTRIRGSQAIVRVAKTFNRAILSSYDTAVVFVVFVVNVQPGPASITI